MNEGSRKMGFFIFGGGLFCGVRLGLMMGFQAA